MVEQNVHTETWTYPAFPIELPGVYLKHMDESCRTLLRLADYIPRWGMDKTARLVAGALCSYVDAEFGRHRKDQESGLFPALRARASAGDIDLLDALIKQLVAEHAAIAQSWTRLRANLSDIVLCRPVKLSADAVASFANLYQDHVNSENARLVSVAARIIDLGDGMKTGTKSPADSRASTH